MASGTSYVSPYAPAQQIPGRDAEQDDDRSYIEPSPDSTIEALQPSQPEPVEELTTGMSTRRRTGRPLKEHTAVADAGTSDHDMPDIADSTLPINTIVNKDEIMANAGTAHKGKRSATPVEESSEQPPQKRKYKKRASKVVVPAPIIVPVNLDPYQQLQIQVRNLEYEVAASQSERQHTAGTLIVPLSHAVVRQFVVEKTMRDFPTMSLMTHLQAASTHSAQLNKNRKKVEVDYTAQWVNCSPSDIVLIDDMAEELSDGEDRVQTESPNREESVDEDSESSPTLPTRKTGRKRKSIASSPKRSARPKKNSAKTKSYKDETSPKAHSPESAANNTSKGKECVAVGILKKKPHNVVTAGFDTIGRLNWRVLETDREGNYLGKLNAVTTKREFVDLHPTLSRLTPEEFRMEVTRRQDALDREHASQ